MIAPVLSILETSDRRVRKYASKSAVEKKMRLPRRVKEISRFDVR